MKTKASNGKQRNGDDPNQAELFAVVWFPPEHPFRLRVNDHLRVDGQMARVIKVTESAAVLLVNQPLRVFKTRFDKPVRFRPPPKITRMSANAECEILYRKTRIKHQQRRLPIPQQFGFSAEAFNLSADTALDGWRIAREREVAEQANRRAEVKQPRIRLVFKRRSVRRRASLTARRRRQHKAIH